MPRSTALWSSDNHDARIPDYVGLRVCERQNWICACGCMKRMNPNVDRIDIDHKQPLADGGAHHESNLQALLWKCHKPKTSLENSQRSEARRHQAKAFVRAPKRSSFPTNRNGEFKKRMDGTVVRRRELSESPE